MAYSINVTETIDIFVQFLPLIILAIVLSIVVGFLKGLI